MAEAEALGFYKARKRNTDSNKPLPWRKNSGFLTKARLLVKL